jgi:serine/threonine protein kinase
MEIESLPEPFERRATWDEMLVPLAPPNAGVFSGDALVEALIRSAPMPVPRALDFARVFALFLASRHIANSDSRRILWFSSPWFTAPEEMSGAEPARAGDVYAFGVLVLLAAVGPRPFGNGPTANLPLWIAQGEPLPDTWPPELVTLIRTSLVQDPAKRLSAAQIVGYLGDGWTAVHPLVAPQPPAFHRDSLSEPPAGRRPGILRLRTLVTGAVLLTVGVIVVVQLMSSPGPGAVPAFVTSPGPYISADGTVAPPPNSVRLGVYEEDDVIFQGDGLLVTLTNLTVKPGGVLRASVEYSSQDSSLDLSCDGYADPGMDTLTLVNEVLPAADTLCSDNPNGSWTINPGQSLMSYADFQVAIAADESFALSWQNGQQVSGTASRLYLP